MAENVEKVEKKYNWPFPTVAAFICLMMSVTRTDIIMKWVIIV